MESLYSLTKHVTEYLEGENPFWTVHLPKQTAFQKENMEKDSELEVEIHWREKICPE